MRLGIDFDNTLISYDEVFCEAAAEFGVPGIKSSATKRDVRDRAREMPDGEIVWQKLQARVYAHRIVDAEPYPGVKEFVARSCQAGIPLHIVSHKTAFAAYDDARRSLPDAAKQWLVANGIVGDAGSQIPAANVFFEPTRESKIDRIASLGCTDFIDDLLEVFVEERFPNDVARHLFAVAPPVDPLPAGIDVYASWSELETRLLGAK